MGRVGGTLAIVAMMSCGCGASPGGGNGATTPAGLPSWPSPEARFAELEALAVTMDPTTVAELPDVAESNVLMQLEATVESPPRDPVLGGFPLEPPSDWTVGASEDGHEVRVELLEPEGGQVVVVAEAGLELSAEVTVTWIVRYERRNVRLTEEGASSAIHVTPMAARLDPGEGAPPLIWISAEAPEPDPR